MKTLFREVPGRVRGSCRPLKALLRHYSALKGSIKALFKGPFSNLRYLAEFTPHVLFLQLGEGELGAYFWLRKADKGIDLFCTTSIKALLRLY